MNWQQIIFQQKLVQLARINTIKSKFEFSSNDNRYPKANFILVEIQFLSLLFFLSLSIVHFKIYS